MSLRLRLVSTLVVVAIPLVGVLTWARGVLDYNADVDSLHRFIAGRMEDGRAACEADPEHFPHPPRERGGPPRRPDGGGRPPRDSRGSRPSPGGPPMGRPPGPRDGPPRGRPDGRLEGRPEGRPTGRPGEPGRAGPAVELFAYYPDFTSANPEAPPFPEELRRTLERGEARADEKFRDRDRGRGRAGIRVAARMDWEEGPCAIVLAIRPRPETRFLTGNQLITAGALALGLALAVFLAAGPIVGRVRKLTGEVRRSAVERYARPVTVAGNDEIALLAREFNNAGEEIQLQFKAVEEREKALRTFVANTTHDVMIPMTVLQGHLSALRDSVDRPDPDVLHDAMEEVQYMTSLLQNLSASAKLEAGELSIETGAVHLNALVERVVARHAPIGRQKDMELNHSVPEEEVLASGDVTLIEQAVSNLVHNAVRYGKSGGHVALLLDAESDGAWRLRVLDDGPGIEDESIERLVERSFRGDAARSRHPEGQGLGLHIAFEVARRHDFELSLRRSEFGGLEAELRPKG